MEPEQNDFATLLAAYRKLDDDPYAGPRVVSEAVHRREMRSEMQTVAARLIVDGAPLADVEHRLWMWNAERDALFSRTEVLATIRAMNHILVSDRMIPSRRRKDDAPAFVSARELAAERPDDGLEWTVENFLPRGYLCILGGTSKAGKSVLVTALALAVARGESFLDHAIPAASPVLWCAYEESIAERLNGLAPFGELPDNFFLMRERLAIDDPESLSIMERWIEERSVRLLVVDPLYCAHSQEGLTDGQSARRALQGLKDLATRTDCSVVVIHHVNKNLGIGMTRDRIADSHQILAAASMDLLMDAKCRDDGSCREIRLTGRGRGSFCNREWRILSEGPTDFRTFSEAEGEHTRPVTSTMRKIMNLLETETELTALAIAQKIGLAASTCRTVLKALVERGDLVSAVSGTRGNEHRFSLRCSD